MKMPNGYGSVTKLSGNRRKPFRVRKTVGWKFVDTITGKDIDPSDKNVILSDHVKEVQVFQTIGYYSSRTEALQALAEYNADPYDLHINKMTLEELYDKWSDEHYEQVSASNVTGCKAAWKLLTPLHNMKIGELKLDHFQKILDESGKNSPTLKKVKIVLGLMYDYGVRHEYLNQDKRDMIRYIDISKAGNPNARKRDAFTKAQVKTVWKWKDSNEYFTVILMMIYSGVRIGEFLDLKKENVNLEEKWFDITASKTKAGIRRVPISDKVLPFFETWYHKNESDYLLTTPEGAKFEYRNFYDSYWTPLIAQAGLPDKLTPHCTRHTCISLLTAAGVDERIIQKIVGHKGLNVTQIVYTHFEIEDLLDAINKI